MGRVGNLAAIFALVAGVIATPLCVSLADEAKPGHFDFDSVVELARATAAGAYQPVPEAPPAVRGINYDHWRNIRFRKENALWADAGLKYTVEFFHLGFLFTRPVVVHEVDSTGVHPVTFGRALFDYSQTDLFDKVSDAIGFAGFRIHCPMNRPDYYDELGVFLGASYFRALGRAQVFGLSARGLAVDTGLDEGEEFPFFREFWLVRPGKDEEQLTLYALLDSASVAGAYRFEIQPGVKTVLRVSAMLFIRKEIKKLGIAPLTGMFYFGKNEKLATDFRPEVHDADGLVIEQRNGERLWRPLVNPQRLRISLYPVGTPAGFGLEQRDTQFDHYQDLEAHYELRPSAWIVPEGDWGDGHVELVQIPTQTELNDNVVAFWSPTNPVLAKTERRFDYRLEWYKADREPPPGGFVKATRISQMPDITNLKFVIDFQNVPEPVFGGPTNLVADVHIGTGYKLLRQELMKNDEAGGWRLVLDVQSGTGFPLKEKLLPASVPPVELRAVLKLGDKAVTETWTYAYPE